MGASDGLMSIRQGLRAWTGALLVAAHTIATVPAGLAEERPAPPLYGLAPEAWPTSPYHGLRDGSGKQIPCRCRFDGRSYGLGAVVCMRTHRGIVFTRCDFVLNNTSWMPSEVPCRLDDIPS